MTASALLTHSLTRGHHRTGAMMDSVPFCKTRNANTPRRYSKPSLVILASAVRISCNKPARRNVLSSKYPGFKREPVAFDCEPELGCSWVVCLFGWCVRAWVWALMRCASGVSAIGVAETGNIKWGRVGGGWCWVHVVRARRRWGRICWLGCFPTFEASGFDWVLWFERWRMLALELGLELLVWLVLGVSDSVFSFAELCVLCVTRRREIIEVYIV